jgi:hypothetical protein
MKTEHTRRMKHGFTARLYWDGETDPSNPGWSLQVVAPHGNGVQDVAVVPWGYHSPKDLIRREALDIIRESLNNDYREW